MIIIRTRHARISILLAAVTAVLLTPECSARVRTTSIKSSLGSIRSAAGAQSVCPTIFPATPVVVAPNQPEVPVQSNVGLINALCEVTLDFVGCGFTPTSITLGCDSNGDAVADLVIPLKNITVVNRLLLQATIPALVSSPGTAFPLACCGGVATITLTRTVSASDDNIFGPFTQTQVCSIDLGIRAPVVVSATPGEGDCASSQDLLIPGSCFLLADGKPNVTSVFAVEAGNPSNVIQSSAIHILNMNLLDAFFQPGPGNAGKTFLIFASGPNGTSRNLSAVQPGAPLNCPLGNEQGVTVTFKCKAVGGSGETPVPPVDPVMINTCRLDRTEAGGFTLTVTGFGLHEGSTLTIGGLTPKKLKYKDFDATRNSFNKIIVKGRVCDGLPGAIVYSPPSGPSFAFFCSANCQS